MSAVYGEPVPPNPLTADLTPEEKAQTESLAFATAHEIIELAKFRDHDGGERGYGNTEYDVPANRVDLWWKGALDDDVASIVSSATKRGVTVDVHPVERTLRTTQQAQRRLIGSPELERAKINLIGLRPERDMSGIHVTIQDDAEDQSAAGKENRAAQVKEIGNRVTGLTILTVQESKLGKNLVGKRPAVTYPSDPCSPSATPCRQDDAASWSGGATLSSSTRPVCSTGFAVEMNSGSDIARMLT